MGLTVEQCRAARALLGWSANDLAVAAELGIATVKRFESGQVVNDASVTAIADALQNGGVLLLAAGDASGGGGVGVRLSAR